MGAAPLPAMDFQFTSFPWREVQGNDEAPRRQVGLTGDHLSSSHELQPFSLYLAWRQAEETRLFPEVFLDSLQHHVWRSAPFLLDQTLAVRDSKAHRLSYF